MVFGQRRVLWIRAGPDKILTSQSSGRSVNTPAVFYFGEHAIEASSKTWQVQTAARVANGISRSVLLKRHGKKKARRGAELLIFYFDSVSIRIRQKHRRIVRLQLRSA